jgi:tRNA pseudouridine55 synthase
MLTGFLAVNKPVGLRSTQCVEMVRAVLGKDIKTGHGGTLDSTAAGVLVLLIGAATRLSSFVMEMPKQYETVIQLGSETSTDDASGELTVSKEWHNVDETVMDLALCSFMGWRMQAPPSVSAVHVEGKRAHEIARSGHNVTVAAKPVFFGSVRRNSSISAEGQVSFVIGCHKGTYIRSFARDLGRMLGTAAHVIKLKRTQVGPFIIDNCVDANAILPGNRNEMINKILPVETLCVAVPTYGANDILIKRLANGQAVSASALKRINFGKYAVETSKIIVASQSLFSICESCNIDGQMEFSPVVNIFKDRG